MVQTNSTAKVVKKKEAVFDPASLTNEQLEAAVEEYLGIHPKYFLYEGLAIRLNHGFFEADQREVSKRTGKPRKWFDGWKPKPNKYR